MTPKERAEEIGLIFNFTNQLKLNIAQAITEAVAEALIKADDNQRHNLFAAIAEEREACAEVADRGYFDLGPLFGAEDVAKHIAAAIRARSD